MKKNAIFHFLPAKVAPCPLGLGKVKPLKGLAGEKSSSLRRYFSPPNLAQSGHGGNPASKKQKYWLQEPVQV